MLKEHILVINSMIGIITPIQFRRFVFKCLMFSGVIKYGVALKFYFPIFLCMYVEIQLPFSLLTSYTEALLDLLTVTNPLYPSFSLVFLFVCLFCVMIVT